MARLVERVWTRYDDLSDPQRVLLGAVVALVLAASALYLLGAASLVALQRLPDAALAAAPPLDTPLEGMLEPDPRATEVSPISPLLAVESPTPRPTFTPRPTSTATLSPTATPTRPRTPGTATRTPTRGPGTLAPTPTVPGLRPNAAVPSTPLPPRVATSTPTR